MTNHVHLLIERRADTIGRIMHRLLTGYSQYYNRKYGRVGHLLQGRHKSILCQSEMYMGELVRYIHLNPVRARIVEKAEDYPYSSQREYLGLRPAGILDVDPVLRLFHAKKDVVRQQFAKFVAAGISHGHREEFDVAEDGRILGSEAFVDSTIHRIGVTGRPYKPTDGRMKNGDGKIDADALIAAVESVCGISRDAFCGPTKSAPATAAREVLIVAGRHTASSTRKPAQSTLYNPIEQVIQTYNKMKN